jgi:epoxide hydrolase
VRAELPSRTDVLPPLRSTDECRPVHRIAAFTREEYGYIAIQSTRPQTIAYRLTDSSIGQLAWIMDKFREWTHPRNTVPDNIIDRDRLLTNASPRPSTFVLQRPSSAASVGH